MLTEMIVRRVRVNRARTPQQMIHSLGRTKYVINYDILDTMPGRMEVTNEVELFLFPGKRIIQAVDLSREFELRGLTPDYYAQVQLNIDDPSFADQYPNGAQWPYTNDGFYFLWFDVSQGRRQVSARWSNSGYWLDHQWFAGVATVTTEPEWV